MIMLLTLFRIMRSLLIFLLLNLCLADEQQLAPITVIGLGGMGRAVAECFASKGHVVHAWNRGQENREKVRGITNMTVHEHLQEAVEASNVIAMVVVADRNLAAATSIIESIPAASWKKKTLIQYTTHEPNAILAQEELMTLLGAKLIGGAIVAVPHLVCSNTGSYLVSSTSDEVLEETMTILEKLGPVTTYPGNVGYASLAYLGLIQSLQFGLAGHELSLLLMKRYGAPPELIQQYTSLIQSNVPVYFKRFTGLATKAVLENDFESLARTFLPSPAYLEILEMQASFCEQMGIVLEDTFLDQYLQVFRRLPQDGSVGPTAVIQHYKTIDDKAGGDSAEL